MSRFLEEIHQQPEALRELLGYYRGAGGELLEEVAEQVRSRAGRLLFTGMGSSFFAPLAVRYRLLRGGIETEIWEAGELLHYGLDRCAEQAVMVAISQSGESAETRRVVERVRGKCPLVTVTNDAQSYLGRSGDVMLPMRAGEEASISTKTYTNTLALLHLLAAVLTDGDDEREFARLERLADEMDVFLKERQDGIAAAAEFLVGVPFLYFIGRGPALAAAHQGALTFNEGARLPTCALAGGTFRHGPFELVDERFAAVFLVPGGNTRDMAVGMACEVAEAGGRVLLLTDGAADDLPSGIHAVRLPGLGEELFSLNVCLPVEQLLFHVAQQRGREAGVFERIDKVTRRE